MIRERVSLRKIPTRLKRNLAGKKLIRNIREFVAEEFLDLNAPGLVANQNVFLIKCFVGLPRGC